MYFTDISIFISKEYLQPYISVEPSLSQDATCSDQVFLRVLCLFLTVFIFILVFLSLMLNRPQTQLVLQLLVCIF